MNILSLPGRLSTTASTLLCAAFFGWLSPASAQMFRPAATLEQMLTSGNAKLVQNTGCGQSTDGSNELQVMVWDGVSPSFGWSYSGTTTVKGYKVLNATQSGYTVSDPDIVAYHEPGGKHRMVATYLINLPGGVKGVAYEVQSYSVSTNTWSVDKPVTRLDAGAASCNSPNLDVTRVSGNVVFIFQKGVSIFARVLHLPSNTLHGTTTVDAAGGGSEHRQPDVTLYETTGNPTIVSTAYITEDVANGSIEVTTSYDQLPDVITGTGAFPAPQHAFGPTSTSPLPLLEWPRIAAPISPSASPGDCLIVFRHNNGSGDEIVTVSVQAGTPSLGTHVVNAPLTSLYANARPVVTYVGDGAVVAWQYDDTAKGFISGTVDILGTWVDTDGIPMLSPLDLLEANQLHSGAQAFPSVEARNGLNAWSSGFLIIWHDNTLNDIAYKPKVSWGGAAMRPTMTATGKSDKNTLAEASALLSVYPSPASRGARVAVQVKAGEQVQALDVIELRTGAVVQSFSGVSLVSGAGCIDLPTLPAGLYLLRLQTGHRVQFTRFSFQP